MNRSTRSRARLAAVVATALLALSFATVGVSAKELTSGRAGVRVGSVGGGGTCSPVRNLTYRGDATTSDTAAATITIDHRVRSCNGEPLRVELTLFETADPSVVVHLDTDAPAAARTTVGGITANRSYIARVTVRSAVDGTERATSQIYAAAITKGV